MQLKNKNIEFFLIVKIHGILFLISISEIRSCMHFSSRVHQPKHPTITTSALTQQHSLLTPNDLRQRLHNYKMISSCMLTFRTLFGRTMQLITTTSSSTVTDSPVLRNPFT